MTQKINLDYVTSKLDYKREEVVDLYTLRIRRSKEESKEATLKTGLELLLNNDNS